MTNYELEYWLKRAQEAKVPIFDIAKEGLQVSNFRYRASAVAVLNRFGERAIEPIMGSLADEYPQVRVAAIRALEQLKPDGDWRDHLVLECYIPAGCFTMGSDDDDDTENERPSHQIKLPAFYIGRYTITNADYKLFVDDTEYVSPAHWGGDKIPKGKEKHPVVHVSQHHAQDYATWAGVRLPTEAEWEKAARGTYGRIYPWGNEFDIKDENKCNSCGQKKGKTKPVGQYPQGDSPYGCADMAGNVLEWTSTVWGSNAKISRFKYPYNSKDGREGINTPGRRVLRGGHYDTGTFGVRCARRIGYWPDCRGPAYGFRVAMPSAEGVVALNAEDNW